MKYLILAITLIPIIQSKAQTIDIEAETNHSTIEFFVGISEGLTKISGKFTDFKIKMQMIDSSLLKSSIEVDINPSSINTGIPARDEDLKSSDFFDVTKYPAITFKSDKIYQEDDHFVVEGKCSIHGITKEIKIPFVVNGAKDNYVIGFSGTFTIKRSDYSIGTTWKHTTDDNFISDAIEVHIDFWTRKPRRKN